MKLTKEEKRKENKNIIINELSGKCTMHTYE